MYFENIPLLQNTLLLYFDTENPLNLINKQFRKLNYEKYLTHRQPHGIFKSYYNNGKIKEQFTCQRRAKAL